MLTSRASGQSHPNGDNRHGKVLRHRCGIPARASVATGLDPSLELFDPPDRTRHRNVRANQRRGDVFFRPRRLVDAGGSLVDGADTYGECEAILGRWLASTGRREQVALLRPVRSAPRTVRS